MDNFDKIARDIILPQGDTKRGIKIHCDSCKEHCIVKEVTVPFKQAQEEHSEHMRKPCPKCGDYTVVIDPWFGDPHLIEPMIGSEPEGSCARCGAEIPRMAVHLLRSDGKLLCSECATGGLKCPKCEAPAVFTEDGCNIANILYVEHQDAHYRVDMTYTKEGKPEHLFPGQLEESSNHEFHSVYCRKCDTEFSEKDFIAGQKARAPE